MKCLVTKLNGTVGNTYIPKIGYFPIVVKDSQDTKPIRVCINTSDIGETVLYLPNDGSYITSKEGEGNLGTEDKMPEVTFNIVYLSNNTHVAFVNKYKLSYLELTYDFECVSLENLAFSNVINISANLSGNFEDLPDSILNNIAHINVYSESKINDVDLAIFQNNNVIDTLIFEAGNISGDLSKVSKKLYQFSAKKSKLQITYTGTRPSDSKCLAVYGNTNLGNYVDAFLIDNAKFAKGDKPQYSWNVIEILGTRTSASDAAVSKLQEFGLTVSVTPM